MSQKSSYLLPIVPRLHTTRPSSKPPSEQPLLVSVKVKCHSPLWWRLRKRACRTGRPPWYASASRVASALRRHPPCPSAWTSAPALSHRVTQCHTVPRNMSQCLTESYIATMLYSVIQCQTWMIELWELSTPTPLRLVSSDHIYIVDKSTLRNFW